MIGLVAGRAERHRGAIERLTARDGGVAWECQGMSVGAPAGSVDHHDDGTVAVWCVGRIHGVDRPAAALVETVRARGLGDALLHARGEYVAILARAGTTVVTHDHLGARSVVYAAHEGVVAEHVPDLLELLPSTPPPDRLAVLTWIDSGTLPGAHSLFTGIRRLPAGRLLELDGSGLRDAEHWAPRFDGVLGGSRDDIVDLVREAAFAAVERAVLGAGRPAVALSGGLDSGTVAAALAARREPGMLGLAAVFPDDPEVDETPLIEATASATGLELHTVPYRSISLLAPATGYITRWRQPPASANLFVWQDYKVAVRRAGIDVLVDGEGGDESFGLTPFLLGDRLRTGRWLDAWRLTAGFPGVSPDDTRTRMHLLRVYGVSGSVPYRIQAWRRARRPAEHVVSRLIRRSDVPALRAIDDPWSFKRRDGPLWWRARAEDYVTGADALDASGYLQRFALDAGYVRRHPFLHDHALMEVLLAVPPELTFDAERDRPLLRDAMRGHLPDMVRARHAKSYFTSLTASRIENDDGAILRRMLGRRDSPIREFVDGASLDRLIAQTGAAGIDFSVRRLLTVGLLNAWLIALSDDAVLAALTAPQPSAPQV